MADMMKAIIFCVIKPRNNNRLRLTVKVKKLEAEINQIHNVNL